jgi:protein gp37
VRQLLCRTLCGESDLFHKEIPTEYIDRVFDVMERAHWHVFQVLTKRSTILKRYISKRYKNSAAPPHIWLGVSLEDATQLSRLKHLRDAPASVRFLSIEPLLGPVGKINLDGIHWVIVGSESGPRHRPIEIGWVREIRDQCSKEKVPFFVKQWGGARPKTGGRELDGRTWDQIPSTPAYSIAAE